MAATPVVSIPAITREEAEGLATQECTRLVELLRSLAPEDWSRPTDCPLWDVRAMVGHSVGMMTDFTSYRGLVRRMRAATKDSKASGNAFIDSMTALQVAGNAALPIEELVTRAAEDGPKSAHWRAKVNPAFRRIPMKQEVGDHVETWRWSYLLDVILTRDPWMHRVDIARATGRPVVLTADHDGRIVADVVAEWARRHGQPFTLSLTGPAGGEFVAGAGGEHITIDAVEFCRTSSGRAEGRGLLGQEVPF